MEEPLPHCGKAVRANQDGLFCEMCLYWNHCKCVFNMSFKEYYHWSSIDDDWVCQRCEREALKPVSSLPPVHRPYQRLSNFQIRSAILFKDLCPVVFQKEFSIIRLGVSCQNWTGCTQPFWHTRSYDTIMVVETWLSADILDYNIPARVLLAKTWQKS